MPLITKPTRVTSRSATIIDNIFSNRNQDIEQSGIIINDIADHFGVFAIFHQEFGKPKPTFKQFRSFNDENVTKFRYLLQNADFSAVFSGEDANYAYNTFLKIYQEHFETAFPLKTKRENNKYVKCEPWMTAGLVISSNNKHKLFLSKLKKPSDHNVTKYKQYNSVFNKLRRHAKSKYYADILAEHKHDSKRTCRYYIR